jgi:hypothetical protein
MNDDAFFRYKPDPANPHKSDWTEVDKLTDAKLPMVLPILSTRLAHQLRPLSFSLAGNLDNTTEATKQICKVPKATVEASNHHLVNLIESITPLPRTSFNVQQYTFVPK